MKDPLGPCQAIWESWNDVDDEIAQKPLTHFRRAVEIQFDELEAHLAADDRNAASREAIDIISIALNIMRWLRFTPEEISEIARSRAELRMKGQTLAILEKYQKKYQI